MAAHASPLFLQTFPSLAASSTPELVDPDELLVAPDDDEADELDAPPELPPDDALELLELAPPSVSPSPSCKPDWSTSTEHAPAAQAIATTAERRIPMALESTRGTGGAAPPNAPTRPFSWSYGRLPAVR